jgi:hypothetical protein
MREGRIALEAVPDLLARRFELGAAGPAAVSAAVPGAATHGALTADPL